MRNKYDPRRTKKVKNELRKLRKKGLPVDAAVNVVRKRFRSYKPNTLRNMAYWLKDEGIDLKVSKRKLHTIHEQLKSKCKRRFGRQGYIVLDNQHEIRKFMKELGSRRVDNPDLIALRSRPYRALAVRIYKSKPRDPQPMIDFKTNDVLLIEIVEWEKGRGTLMSQIERYSEVGKVILVLPVNTTNIEFLGIQTFKINSVSSRKANA